MIPPSNPLLEIVGTELSAVVFVRDYLQFQFDGPSMSAMTPVTVTTAKGSVTSGDDQFRNRLCEQIGKKVSQVAIRESEALNIAFTDGSLVLVSLKNEDYGGPEAVVFQGRGGSCVVL